jgi:predicted nucleotidyltransferase
LRASRSGESALLLLDVKDALVGGGTDFAVIGALAASMHGVVRASLDADAVLGIAPREADRLKQILEAAGFQVQLNRGDMEDPIPALLQVQDQHGNRVDLLLGLRGMDPGLFSRALEVPFQDGTFKVVGLEDFIAMKAFAGGPVDLLDASHAIEAAGGSLDHQLLRRLAAGYGRESAAVVESLLAEPGRKPV